MEVTETAYLPICSGSLIAPDAFLTAGHCIHAVEAFLPPDWEYGVVFGQEPDWENPDFHPLRAEGGMVNAGFAEGGKIRANDPRDLGLLHLRDEVHGIELGTLADVGALDRLTRRQLNTMRFTSVGYGTEYRLRISDIKDDYPPPRTPTFGGGGRRMQSQGTFLSLTSAMLTTSMVAARGDGGNCYGDSGGPILATIDGEEVIVAVVYSGDRVCQATSRAYRTDGALGAAFLAAYR